MLRPALPAGIIGRAEKNYSCSFSGKPNRGNSVDKKPRVRFAVRERAASLTLCRVSPTDSSVSSTREQIVHRHALEPRRVDASDDLRQGPRLAGGWAPSVSSKASGSREDILDEDPADLGVIDDDGNGLFRPVVVALGVGRPLRRSRGVGIDLDLTLL